MLSVTCRAVLGILPAGFFSRDFTGFGTIPRSREKLKSHSRANRSCANCDIPIPSKLIP